MKIVGALFNHARRQGVIQNNPLAAIEIDSADSAASAVKEPFTAAEVGA